MPSLFKWRTSLPPGHPRNIVPAMFTCNFWGLLFVVDRTPCWEGLSGIGNQDWPERRPVSHNLAKQISQNAIRSQFSSLLCNWGLVRPGVVNCLFSVKVAPRILSSVLDIPRARTPYLPLSHSCILTHLHIFTLDNRYVNAANGQKQILIIQVFPGAVFNNWVEFMNVWVEGQSLSE